jgi:alpha-L-rhamnosidase
MPTLTQIGQNDLAYRLLNNTGFPSWGYEINLGATTIWERWNGYTKEKGFNTPTMNSFNHYTFGSVGEWLYSTVAGIDSDGPAFRKIFIHPQPGGSINWVKSEYDSINGVIASNWKMDGGVFSLDVTIPANTAATVYIPASNADAVKEGGVAAKDAIGVKFLRMENGCAVFQTGSGNYGFVAK